MGLDDAMGIGGAAAVLFAVNVTAVGAVGSARVHLALPKPSVFVRDQQKPTASVLLNLQQGRTLFYRDGVIVDTQFSNLAPAGYTDSVIDALWPAATTP